jgi:hypothetical protein
MDKGHEEGGQVGGCVAHAERGQGMPCPYGGDAFEIRSLGERCSQGGSCVAPARLGPGGRIVFPALTRGAVGWGAPGGAGVLGWSGEGTACRAPTVRGVPEA